MRISIRGRTDAELKRSSNAYSWQNVDKHTPDTELNHKYLFGEKI